MDLISALTTDFAIATLISFLLSLFIFYIFIRKKNIKIFKKPFYAFIVLCGTIISSITLIHVVIPSFIYWICLEWVSWAFTKFIPLYTFLGCVLILIILLYTTYHVEMKWKNKRLVGYSCTLFNQILYFTSTKLKI